MDILQGFVTTPAGLYCILKFLPAHERYRFSQLCQIFRSCVLDERLEFEALAEYGKQSLFCPLSASIYLPPFPSELEEDESAQGVNRYLQKLIRIAERFARMETALTSWHAVCARSQTVSRRNMGCFRMSVKASIPSDARPPTASSTVAEAWDAIAQSLSHRCIWYDEFISLLKSGITVRQILCEPPLRVLRWHRGASIPGWPDVKELSIVIPSVDAHEYFTYEYATKPVSEQEQTVVLSVECENTSKFNATLMRMIQKLVKEHCVSQAAALRFQPYCDIQGAHSDDAKVRELEQVVVCSMQGLARRLPQTWLLKGENVCEIILDFEPELALHDHQEVFGLGL